MTTRLVLCWLYCFVWLAACAQPDPTPVPTDPPATAVPEPSSTPTQDVEPTAIPPTPTPVVLIELLDPTAVPTATPEPIAPEVSASAQLVDDAGVLTVDRVMMAEAGWLALFSGDVLLGAMAVDAGETRALEFTVDPLAIGDVVQAGLFAAGDGAFSAETPPILQDGDPVTTTFEVDLQISKPQLAAIDQAVQEDGIVRLTNVVALNDGWLVAYNDDNGELGEQLGVQWVFAGTQGNVPIPITWRNATPTVRVVLHDDGGTAGMFEPDSDTPVMVGGEMVSAEFRASYPPDIAIINQPVISNTVVIDRVISDGPGWLAVSFETEQEQPGNIIGFAPLVDGVNEQVVVEVVPSAVTPILYAQVHEDSGETGVFDFPGGDPPVQHEGEIYTFPFATDTGNYVVSLDQPITYADGKASINVPLVVADVNVFAVVRANLEGTPGDVIGSQWLPAGVSRDVVVEIDAEQATDQLFLVMHIDRDQLQVLEYPEGRDFELQRRRAPIAAPFFILDQ